MLKIFPEILLRATNSNKAVGGFKLWFLAKNFDKGGSGFIPAKVFRYHLLGLGVTRPTLYRWIDQAKTLNLITQQGGFYRLSAWQAGAQVAGVTQLKPPVKINTQQFIEKGWLGVVWSAYLTHFKGPVARATLESLTGTPASTQRHYERQANTKKTANYAVFSTDPDMAIMASYQPGSYGTHGRIARQLPNKYHPTGVLPANKGRTRQINRFLSSCNQEDSIQEKPQRLYCKDSEQVKTAQRQNRKVDAQTRAEVFYTAVKAVRSGVMVWQGVPF